MPTISTSASKPVAGHPWNKGKIAGAKPPLQPKHVWTIRSHLQLAGRPRDLACLTSPWIANSGDAISCASGFVTLLRMATPATEPPSGSERRDARSGSRLPSKRGNPSTTI